LRRDALDCKGEECYFVASGGYFWEERSVERVGVKEFKNRATQYLRMGKPIAIERHGQVIGYYIPVAARDEAEIRRRREAFERSLEAFLAKVGLTEEELARLVNSGE
jgi:Fe-S cluster assembly ATPase SufC